MLCKTCGGKLAVKGDFYICESCGNKVTISTLYENTDAYIAYIENDEQGRRTKDSIIAQEVFNKFEASKISAFYQRISVDGLNDTDYEIVNDSALSSTKNLILIGTNKENFEKLVEQYRPLFKEKTIIPIYFGMDAYDLPDDIKRLQASNYDSVGSINDIIKNILTGLGRGAEIDVVAEANRKSSRKKKVIVTTTITLIALVLGIAAYVVFGTTYVLPSKKYDYATQLIEENDYVSAIDILTEIKKYKDSSDILKNIYAQYAGYYQSEDKSVGIHFTVDSNSKASIEIDRFIQDKGMIAITESAEIVGNEFEISFTDSENNQGSAIIKLINNGIDLSLKIENESEINQFFDISNKSDKPIIEEITAQTIKDWLSKNMTENDFISKGYELEHLGFLGRACDDYSCKIVNTDIEAMFYGYDGKSAVAYSAPAKILIPNKIGQKAIPYVENDILYVPNGDVSGEGMFQFYIDSYGDDIVKDDTIVSCTSKKMVDNETWNEFLIECVYKEHILAFAENNCSDDYDYWNLKIEAENDGHYLFSIAIESEAKALMFKISKNTYNVELMPEVFYDYNGFSGEAMWQMYEEFYYDFPEPYSEY